MIPCIIEQEENSKEYRKNWARLIQKIYEFDPLTCPKCQGKMSIISFIEDKEVAEKILKHLGLWLVKRNPPPKANAPPQTTETYLDYSHWGIGPYGPEVESQLPTFENYLYVDGQHKEAFSV